MVVVLPRFVVVRICMNLLVAMTFAVDYMVYNLCCPDNKTT